MKPINYGFATAALIALALAPGPAIAAVPSEACAPAETSRPFLPWIDPAHYVPAPEGDLEGDASSWTLSAGATTVAGNEPFHVGSTSDERSLLLPAGSSARTAPMCIGVEHPTVRLFAKRSAGPLTSPLQVEALFTDRKGHNHAVSVGTISSLGNWAPSAPLPILINVLALTQPTLKVSFRFTPRNHSEWTIDDIYVDPFRTN